MPNRNYKSGASFESRFLAKLLKKQSRKPLTMERVI